MTEIYDVGDKIRMSAVFTAAGALMDPTDVYFRLYIKKVFIVEHEFGISPALIRDSVGRYHMDFIIPTRGYWSYKAIGTGAVVAVETSFFIATE